MIKMKNLIAIILSFAFLASCSWNSKNVKVLSQVREGVVLHIETERMQCVSMQYRNLLALRCLEIDITED